MNKRRMKKTILIGILLSFGFTFAFGQSRSGQLSFGEQSIGVATGMDYSILPMILSYDRGMKVLGYQYPISLGAELTAPLFSPDVHDLRLRVRCSTTLYQLGNFALRAGFNPVLVTSRLKTQNIVSLGTEIDFFAGFSNERWNAGLEASYNKIFSSFIRHTDLFRDHIFAEVQDGWYRNTASNLRLGVLVNYRIGKLDLFLRTGLSRTGRFSNYLFVPTIYTMLGAKFRF